MRFVTAVLSLIAFVASASAAPATMTATSATTLPANAGIQTCLATAADLTAVYPTSTFPFGTREMCVTVPLDKKIAKLTSKWIAVDVGEDIAPANSVITTADMDVAGSDRARFRYSQPRPMPPGRYRVEISADGAALGSASFMVEEKAMTTNVRQPEDLLPLRPGLVWTFECVEQSSEGPESRKIATMTVIAEDAQGAHMKTTRDGGGTDEEWWTLDKTGLSATQRRKGDEPGVVLDPPQVLWSWPLRNTKTWNYRPRDRSYSQSYRMWGPLPVESPAGAVPGYVVLCEQKGEINSMTAERHWIPGVGLSREIIITAVNDHMVSRQELKLTNDRADAR